MNGKVALVTGSSSGIGAATALHFASLGYKLSLTGRDEQRLQNVRDNCIANGLSQEDVIYTVADLTSLQNIQMLIEKTIEAFGNLNVLVNNAGGLKKYQTIEETTDDEFNYLLDLNLRAPFRLSQLAMPYLVQTKGNVVNVSSVAGQKVIPSIHMYGVSKAGLDHMTRGMARELAPKGVRVNTVSPGCIATEAYESLGFPLHQAEELFSPKIPMGRFGKAEEIAKTIAFIVDNENSSYITGHNIIADGGLSHGS